MCLLLLLFIENQINIDTFSVLFMFKGGNIQCSSPHEDWISLSSGKSWVFLNGSVVLPPVEVVTLAELNTPIKVSWEFDLVHSFDLLCL